MEIDIEVLESLLRDASKKAGRPYDRFGFLALYKNINEALPEGYKRLSERYIYDSVYTRVKKAKKNGDERISLEKASLNSIAHYLGYNDMEAYVSFKLPLIPTEVFALIGNWYSLVRCNSGSPDLLVSPVKVSIEGSHPMLLLRGPHRTFKGQIKWAGGSISAFVTSEDQVKSIHLVFKTGLNKFPDMLYGVFSSISSGGDPIAGKEILVRSKEGFSEMENRKINIAHASEGGSGLFPDGIFEFFSDFGKTNLKITNISTFDPTDLSK